MNNRTQQSVLPHLVVYFSGQEFTIESQPTEYKLMVRDLEGEEVFQLWSRMVKE